MKNQCRKSVWGWAVPVAMLAAGIALVVVGAKGLK